MLQQNIVKPLKIGINPNEQAALWLPINYHLGQQYSPQNITLTNIFS
jgi:hypothetical protein